MRPRTEAIVAIAAILTLAVIAGSLGSRERETGAADLRRSHAPNRRQKTAVIRASAAANTARLRQEYSTSAVTSGGW